MKKIKMLHIIGSSNLGGGENLLCELMKKIDKERFETYIVCPPRGDMLKAYQASVIEVKTLAVDRIWHLSALFQLWRYIGDRKFDVVHTHLYPSDVFGIIAAKLAGTPAVVTTIHGHNFSTVGQTGLRAVKNFIFSLFYRVIYLFNDAVVTVCHALKRDLITRRGIKVRPEKIRVIYNGVDLSKIEGADENSSVKLIREVNGHSPLVGVIANFDPVKGHRNLIKAIPRVVQEIPEMRVLFVGDGEERKFIERMAERFDLSDHLIFTGTRDDTLKIISLCKLIVLPSLLEGFSLVVMEAMALGKPIVASNVGGVPEILENGKTGILVAPNSPEQLAEAMITFLKGESQASKMGNLGRKMIWNDSRFHLGNMVAQTERLYLEVLSGKDKR